jgi:hypothetical protein
MQCIPTNLRDKSDELNDVEDKEHNDSDEPLDVQ